MSEVKFKIYRGDAEVTCQETKEKKTQLFNRIIQFCKDTDCTSGECYHQSDSPQIEAYNLMSDILDNIMKFEINWD